MALYEDLDFRQGSLLGRMGSVGTPTGITWKKDRKGNAIETGISKYIQYNRQLLPDGAFSLVIWGKVSDKHISASDNCTFIADGTNGLGISVNGTTYSGRFYLRMSSNNSRIFSTTIDKKLHCFIVTIPGSGQIDISSSALYIDGVSIGIDSTLTSGTQNARSNFVYTGGGNTSTSGNNTLRIKVYSHVLSTQEMIREQTEFEESVLIDPPISGFTLPVVSDLTRLKNTGLIAAWNFRKTGNVLTDLSGNGRNATVTTQVQTPNGLEYHNKLIEEQNITALPAIGTSPYTISFRVMFKYTASGSLGVVGGVTNCIGIYSSNAVKNISLSLINVGAISATPTTLIANKYYTISIVRASTSANGTSSYINGVLALTFTDSNNYTVGITKLGSSGYGEVIDGVLQDLRIYNKALSLNEIKAYHNSFIKPTLVETFKSVPIGAVPTKWIKGTGTYVAAELTSDVTSGTLKLKKGTRYLSCTGAGTIAIPSQQTYGTWEFGLYKGNTLNTSVVEFISTTNDYSTDKGYTYQIYSDEDVYLTRRNKPSATTDILRSTGSYVANSTYYKVKITRSTAGVFTVLMKGGALTPTAGYDGWHLVSTSGGGGTNPSTDTTYTTSNYIVLDLDSGDRIFDIKCYDGIKQY